MKRHLIFPGLMFALLSACNPTFYQGYDDELYSSASKKVENSPSGDNRYIVSGSNAANSNISVSDIESNEEHTILRAEPRSYLSITIGSPHLYAAFASPAYYDWWFYSPYYGPYSWVFYSPWYYDPLWHWYNPYHARWYYPWPSWHWHWHWYYYPPTWISFSPARERINHRPEMVSLRQSIRNSGNIKNTPSDQRPTLSNGPGSIENRRALGSSKPEITEPNATNNTRPTRPTSGTRNVSITSQPTPTLEETNRSEQNNRRITHTREINRNPGSISTPINTNNRFDLPTDRGDIRSNRLNQGNTPISPQSGNDNLSTPTKPLNENTRQPRIQQQNRNTESNTNTLRTISTDRNTNSNERSLQNIRRESAPDNRQIAPSNRSAPAGSSNPGGRSSIRGKE